MTVMSATFAVPKDKPKIFPFFIIVAKKAFLYKKKQNFFIICHNSYKPNKN